MNAFEPTPRRTSVSLLLAFCLGVASGAPACADEASAKKVLRNMADYVTAQGNVSMKFDAEIEVITPEVQKLQFSSSGDVTLSRPDKARLNRTGGYSDVSLVFDGSTVTVLDKSKNVFAQTQVVGSFDQVVDRLRAEHMTEMPGADLLLSKVYDELMDGVVEAKHIGRGVVGGIECEHLAFRNHETDWQIWVEVGQRPIPRKYVITSKTVVGAPEYTLRITDWNTDAKPDAGAFAYKAPAGATQVDLKALTDIDEVPAGVAVGGTK